MSLGSKKKSLKKITAITLAVLFLDQIIKFIVFKNIFFKIEVYKNYNALFGLPIDFNLVFVLLIVLVFAFYFMLQKEAKLPIGSLASSFPPFKKGAGGISSSIVFGLIFGGIIGNLTDRFFYGHIIDYINLFDLFVFNIADLSICFGVLLLSWKILEK